MKDNVFFAGLGCFGVILQLVAIALVTIMVVILAMFTFSAASSYIDSMHLSNEYCTHLTIKIDNNSYVSRSPVCITPTPVSK